MSLGFLCAGGLHRKSWRICDWLPLPRIHHPMRRISRSWDCLCDIVDLYIVCLCYWLPLARSHRPMGLMRRRLDFLSTFVDPYRRCILYWFPLSRSHRSVGWMSRGRDFLSLVMLFHPICSHMFFS